MGLRARIAAILGIRPTPAPGLPGDKIDRPLYPTSSSYAERPYSEYLAELTDALAAWRQNPLARRIVDTIATYVVGDGITLAAENNEDLAAFIPQFFAHEENLILLRQEEWCRELSRSGDLFLILYPAPLGGGIPYVRAMPGSQIDEIKTMAGDYETELAYHQVGDLDKPEGTWWYSPKGQQDPTAPVMCHYAVNRPVGATRGESDLAPILKWLRRYNGWLEDRVRLNAGVRAFLWIVYAPARLIEKLREQYRTPPTDGAVIIAEDGAERWEAVSPNLNAGDASYDGRAIRWMVIAGSPGLALPDIGEGEDSNLATANAMKENRRRFLGRRQDYFSHVLAHLTLSAYRLAYPNAPVSYDQIKAEAPDISPEDNNLLGQSAAALTQSITQLNQVIGRSPTFNLTALRLWVKFVGEYVSEEELARMVAEGNKAHERQERLEEQEVRAKTRPKPKP